MRRIRIRARLLLLRRHSMGPMHGELSVLFEIEAALLLTRVTGKRHHRQRQWGIHISVESGCRGDFPAGWPELRFDGRNGR